MDAAPAGTKRSRLAGHSAGGQIADGRAPGASIAGTLPGVRSVAAALVGAEQEDVGAVHSGVLAEPRERLHDALVDALGSKIDELRRDAGDQTLERDAGLQRAGALGKRPRVGAQAKEQVGQIGQQQNRREVEQDAERSWRAPRARP